jgi:hypothetical protein
MKANATDAVKFYLIFSAAVSVAFSLFSSELPGSKSYIFNGTVISRPTEQQPFLDGLSLDACWRNTEKYTFTTENSSDLLYLQICRNSSMIFLKIEYYLETFRNTYQNWHWNPVIQAYEPGSEQEETIYIVLKDNTSGVSDIWCWRAARTNPAKKADDMYLGQDGKIYFDNGKLTWFSRFFGNYVGEALPRFYIQPPSGSTADVNATGVFNGKILTIEFSRLLNTGHNDDITLIPGHSYGIAVLRNMPDISSEKHFTKLIIK